METLERKTPVIMLHPKVNILEGGEVDQSQVQDLAPSPDHIQGPDLDQIQAQMVEESEGTEVLEAEVTDAAIMKDEMTVLEIQEADMTIEEEETEIEEVK